MVETIVDTTFFENINTKLIQQKVEAKGLDKIKYFFEILLTIVLNNYPNMLLMIAVDYTNGIKVNCLK